MSVRPSRHPNTATRPEALFVFNVLSIDPATHARVCQAVDVGHVHGTVPCHAHATVHCRRNGEDVCIRHESGHASRSGCGQGEHEPIPVLAVAGWR